MNRCVCCGRPSRSLMGPRCAALACKCEGVFCKHCAGQRVTMRANLNEFAEVLFCKHCGCAFHLNGVEEPSLECGRGRDTPLGTCGAVV